MRVVLSKLCLLLNFIMSEYVLVLAVSELLCVKLLALSTISSENEILPSTWR